MSCIHTIFCRLIFSFLLMIFLVSSPESYSQTFTGRITRIINGDEFQFQTSDSTFTVNMYGIDAPEKGQAYGPQTIAYMETFLWAQAEIRLRKSASQKGIFAILFIDNKDLNYLMVKNGFAWYDRIHVIDEELALAELHARENKLGLWMSKTPVPPWDFREGRLAKPLPTDGKDNVLICIQDRENLYHKRYCRKLELCQSNIIVILRKQAKDLKMKACRFCY